jgi:hypothetical protein
MRDLIRIVENAGGGMLARAYAAAEPYVTENIRELEDIWKGGVADFGESRAAVLIQHQPGYGDYIGEFRDALEYPLVLYRLVPVGAPRHGIVAASISEEIARSFAKFAAHDGQEREIIKIVVDNPFAIVMRGKLEEGEVVIDFNDLD